MHRIGGLAMADETRKLARGATYIDFATEPARYRHWKLSVEGALATLVMDVDEAGGLFEGYALKLNSYDLSVDIELADIVQRLRFEHPAVKAAILRSGKPRVFCAGANIRMLAGSPHEWKVNFCKFTNETRNGMEDAAEHSGQAYLAAVNGSCAGGGYELALACQHILLVDDNSSAVSLPEVALLGVLPGTGGLTRLVEKRHVRKDRADVFATRQDGIRGHTAVEWKLVDETAPPSRFEQATKERAAALAATSTRAGTAGVELVPLHREDTEDGITYDHVSASYDRALGSVAIVVRGPAGSPPATIAEQGAAYWPLAVTRELDDLVLRLRTNEPTLGTWVLTTAGDIDNVLAHERQLLDRTAADDWLANEITHYYKRVLKRLDVTSRSLIALIEPGGCFAGMLSELAFACDRQYILDGPPVDDEDSELRASIVLTPANFGVFPMGNGISRLESRFYGSPGELDAVRGKGSFDPGEAQAHGLVTDAPDDIDWTDEIRIVLEGRAALSPDACTGMEANHRFVGPETMETKIFGRLSAWQNWIFIRPNASGEDGALRRYGSGQKAVFDRKRV
jgi:benzoyl-CoA-dihydrodiol lyase